MIPARFCSPFDSPSRIFAAAVLAAALFLAASPPASAQSGAAEAVSQPTGLWLTTRYPEFSAQAGKDVSIDLSLANHGLPPQRMEFGVDGLPKGWKWEIDGGGKPVTAAIAGSDATVDLTLKLKPPEKAEAGKSVALTISGKGDGQSLQLPMQVTLTETEPAKLTMEPKLPALRGTAKSAFDFQVDIKNDGQEDTTVNLLSAGLHRVLADAVAAHRRRRRADRPARSDDGGASGERPAGHCPRLRPTCFTARRRWRRSTPPRARCAFCSPSSWMGR